MRTILTCTEITDGTTSKMFTKGGKYEQREDGTVTDNLGHSRFIGSSMKFIVQNDFNIFARRESDTFIFYAYFEK